MQSLKQLINDPSIKIVVYCQSGGRSGMAKSILTQAGIDNVFNGCLWDSLQQKIR